MHSGRQLRPSAIARRHASANQVPWGVCQAGIPSNVQSRRLRVQAALAQSSDGLVHSSDPASTTTTDPPTPLLPPVPPSGTTGGRSVGQATMAIDVARKAVLTSNSVNELCFNATYFPGAASPSRYGRPALIAALFGICTSVPSSKSTVT
jgi:hypothetical protein